MLELSKPTDREEESCLQPHWIQCPCPDFPVKTDSFSLVYLLELVQNWPRSSNTVFVAHSHDSLRCLGFPVHRVHPPSLTNCPQEINKYLKLESSRCSLGSFNLDVPTSVMTFLGYASKIIVALSNLKASGRRKECLHCLVPPHTKSGTVRPRGYAQQTMSF